MDLESASRELYAGSPDDFVARRKELVAQARAAKDRPLATAVGALRRPTRSAWLVNLYAREAPEELGALLDLGAALQAAQQQLSGPDLRRLSAERGKALAAATRRAVSIGQDHDYHAPETARVEVTQTLQAALADPEVAAQVRAGTLSQAQSYGGFGFALAPDSTATPVTAPVEEPTGADVTGGRPAEDDGDEARRQAADEERRRSRERAEQQVEVAESELAAAAEEARRATEQADELAERVEQLRTELTSAEEAETAARQDARAARRVVGERESALQDVREALAAL